MNRGSFNRGGNKFNHKVIKRKEKLIIMAAVELSKLSKTEHDELCCVYASLILHDDKVELSVIHPQNSSII